MKTTLLRFSKNHSLFCAALMVALLGINEANAATYYARANGNWNINTTWSLTPGGAAVGVGVWPVAGDIVYISEGATARTVNIPAGVSAACATIYMGGASATSATLNLAASTSILNVSGNVIIYGPTGGVTRSINADGGTIIIGGNLELNNGQTAANGNRVCRLSITTGTVTVSGNLVFNNIGTSSNNQAHIDMSTGAGTFNLAGIFNIVNAHGTLTAGTTSTFNFNGTSAGQTIPVGIAAIVYNNININNTHSSGATLGAAVTATNVTGNISIQTGTLDNGGFAITLASTKNFSVANGATFNLTGISTMVTVSGGGVKTFGPASTVNYSGTNQAVTAESYGNLILGGSGIKAMPASTITVAGNFTMSGSASATALAAINVTGNVTLGSGTSYNAVNMTHNVGGNWLNNGATFSASTSTINLNGSNQQTIDGTNPTSFYNLTLNNANGALLSVNTTVTNILTLTNGIITTGANELIISNTATGAISGASSSRYINGKLRLGIAAGANTYLFPVGTGTAYAPVSMAFAEGTLAGALTGYTTDGDHPNIITSSFSPSSTVNRYWSFMIVSGLGTANYDAIFNWVSPDQDAAFDYTIAYVEKYSAGAWTYPAMGTLTATSAQITGETGFSDFQVGNGCFAPPTATISGNFVTCAGSAVSIRVDLTGTPNWSYTWSDGTNTGTVTDVTESPSFFTVNPTGNKTYTIINVTDNVGCVGSASGSATVTTGPATIAPVITGCYGSIVEVPIRVTSFSNVGAISLTMNYLTAVLEYDSYVPNPSTIIDYVQADESGSTGTIRISGIAETVFAPLNDNDVLITLRFSYKGGYTDLTWNDSGDGTKCEYAAGPPDFIPYCDTPKASYYTAGSVTETFMTADFTVDNQLPATNTTVQFSDLSTGAPTGYIWSFDRTTVVFMNGTDEHSINPQVQFTDGGPYTVSLTVTKPNCLVTETKTAYIQAGLPGVWTGSTSTDWYTATNWDNHVIPASTTDVMIPTVISGNYPLLTGTLPDLTTTVHCRNITVTGDAELYVDGVLTISPGTNLNIRDNAGVYANGK